jgi:hypothetical protein
MTTSRRCRFISLLCNFPYNFLKCELHKFKRIHSKKVFYSESNSDVDARIIVSQRTILWILAEKLGVHFPLMFKVNALQLICKWLLPCESLAVNPIECFTRLPSHYTDFQFQNWGLDSPCWRIHLINWFQSRLKQKLIARQGRKVSLHAIPLFLSSTLRLSRIYFACVASTLCPTHIFPK